MAVAYFMAHAPRGFWPYLNGGEAAVMFCFLFLYLAAAGPGPDQRRRGARSGAMTRENQGAALLSNSKEVR